jgi:hypothetical protein
MPSRALEICVCFHRGPVLGEHGGTLLSWAFERREKFLLIRGNLIEEFEGHVKEGSGNVQLFP